MRTFETLTLLSAFLALASFILPVTTWVAKATVVLPWITAILVVVHLVIEGHRWTMIPFYAFSALLLVVSLVLLGRPNKAFEIPATTTKRRWVTRGLAILGIMTLTGAALLHIQFPVVPLPSPTGPFAVGTTFVQFVDESRLETLTTDPNDAREFMARVWYPADASLTATPVPYQDYVPRVGSISPDGPPDIVFSHLARAASNSYLDAPVSAAQPSYPVLVFSDGFLSNFDGYQLFMEELASHGYVVFSLNNPYESRSVVRPDGTVVPFRAEHAIGFREHMETIIPLWQRFRSSIDIETRNEIAREILQSDRSWITSCTSEPQTSDSPWMKWNA